MRMEKMLYVLFLTTSIIAFICGSVYICDSITYWDRGYSLFLHTNSTHYEILDVHAELNFILGVILALTGVIGGTVVILAGSLFQLVTNEGQCKK